MTLHVIFTADGIPGHISDDPRQGSEPVEGLDLEFLVAHRRNEKGEWVLREPVREPEPTPEQLAAQKAERDRAYAEALSARDTEIELELVRQTGPDQLLRLGGKITIAEFNTRLAAKRAEIEASVPVPERPA